MIARRAAALAAVLALGASGTALAQDRTPCIAARVVGDATVHRGAATQPVRPSMPLRQGDQLVTGAGGRLPGRLQPRRR